MTTEALLAISVAIADKYHVQAVCGISRDAFETVDELMDLMDQNVSLAYDELAERLELA